MARSLQTQDLDIGNAVAIAGYLNEAFKTGDGKTIARAMGVVARARGMTRLAEDTGLERANLYRSLRGNPKLSITMKVLNSFNMQLLVVPKRKRA
jgi:probable addiction module antidote protein